MERCFPIRYSAVFFWSLAVLLGMIGFGRIVALMVGGESAKKAGWGLHAVWGAGLFLFVGGLLGVFRACVEANITVMVLVGLALFIWTTFGAWRPVWADFAAMPWGVWPVFAVVAVTFAGGIFQQTYVNEVDDLPAYFSFCEKLLETGSFEDPFSWRRLASLGGHTLLQCTVLARGAWTDAQAFEVALCPAILLGLILGFRGGALARSWFGPFLALVAVTTPILRVNTASHFTGIIFFMGLFVTLDLIDRAEAHRLRLFVVAGLVAAGLCTLRAQDIMAAGAALGLFWLGSWIKDKRPAREALMEAAIWGAALFLALLPWMIMGYLSSGSPLFPLFQGNNSLAFNPQGAPGPLLFRLSPLFRMMVHPALLPLLLCLFAAPAWRRSLAAQAVSASAVLTSLLLAYGLNLAPDAMTIPRYVQPLLLSSALAALMTGALLPRWRWLAPALAALVFATNLPARAKEFAGHFPTIFRYRGMKMPITFNSVVAANYQDAQLLIPEGKRILVCTDFPFIFNYDRNPIWTVDFPHAASPPPGLPYRKPAEETKQYLRACGVEYLIFQDFSKALDLYNRRVWQRMETGDVLLSRIQAPYCLDFFDTVERLASSETNLGRVGGLTVIQFKP
jgi:hypothetical protein